MYAVIVRPGGSDGALLSLLLSSNLFVLLTITCQVPEMFWVPGATVAVSLKALLDPGPGMSSAVPSALR